MLRQRRPEKEGNEEMEVFIGDAVPNHTATHVFAKEGKFYLNISSKPFWMAWC